MVDLFKQAKATDGAGAPKTTADLLSSDQTSLTKISSDLSDGTNRRRKVRRLAV